MHMILKKEGLRVFFFYAILEKGVNSCGKCAKKIQEEAGKRTGMKYIFLDIDGVLNSVDYFMEDEDRVADAPVDERSVAALARIIDGSGPGQVRIILSSSWRAGWEKDSEKTPPSCRFMDQILGAFGLEIYDKTPELRNGHREDEILLYMKGARERMEAYLILDDYDYSWKRYGMDRHWIRTDHMKGGLMEAHVEDGSRILKRKLTFYERVRLYVAGKRLAIKELAGKQS